jgi:protein gp37
MAENSKIQWCHHTFNPWRGCTKVSAECDLCYAERDSKRFPAIRGVWGKYGTRVIASDAMWKEPLKWNRKAETEGERKRVFCASLADVFEGVETMPMEAVHPISNARFRLFALMASTPDLDWLLLTKRPDNMARFFKHQGYHAFNDYRLETEQWPARNIWCGTSVGVQKTKYRIDQLREVNAVTRFLSIEPLLEDLGELDLAGIHWVIVGGESGPRSRPFDIAWARSIIQQCKAADVPVFVKQLGARPIDSTHKDIWGPNGGHHYRRPVGDPIIDQALNQPGYTVTDEDLRRCQVKDRKGGDPLEWPEDLRVREFPTQKEAAANG